MSDPNQVIVSQVNEVTTVEISSVKDTSFTQTGTGATARTIDSKLKDVVSVKDFNVKGDGSTDDATAINVALIAATGKTLYFPAGTYIIGAELLPKAKTTIVGDGIENTILKASNSLATNITLINIADGQDAVTIRDLRVDGNESNRSSGSGGSNNIMIMSNRNILERVSTIEAENAGILFGTTSDATEENTVSNCIIEDNNGVGLSQSNCSGTIITSNRFARNGLENLTIDAGSNRTICTDNRFFKHLGGVGNIGWDESIDSKICDNFIDNESDTTAPSASRNGICVANQIAGTDPTTHRCMISNNQIVNYKNNGIWLKDTDDSGAVEDAGAFIISNNFLARAASPESGSTDIKIGKTTFKIIVEGNNCEDIDVDDATVTSLWGFSSDVQIGSTKHTVIDQFTETDRANDRLEPSVFVSATYSGGDLTGDPSVPLGIYAQHELKGATSTNAFAHSIMGYGLNNSAGNNDSVGTSGRARKLDVTNGIGDAAGVFGSAYQESTKDGGVMGVEGAIYQNVAGTGASDRIGTKWSASLHLLSDSIGARAVAGIAMDSTGNNSGKHGYWNAIIIDGDTFGSGGASAGTTGTVGLNCGSWSDSVGFPEHGIKFGKVKNGITFNSDVATGGYHLNSPNSPIRAFGNLNVTGAILAQSTGETSLILNADSDDNSVEKGFIDFEIAGTKVANIACNEATSGTPLEINSAVNKNIALVTGGGNVGIGTNSATAKLEVIGNILASATGDVNLILHADTDNNSTSKGFIDFEVGTGDKATRLKGNIAINEAVSGIPLEINSDVNNNLALVTGGGNVGINTNSPTEKLEVNGNIKATTVTETSDIAFKSDIKPITNTLDKLQQITGYKYKLDNASINSMGVIAQDVEKVFPELVHGDEGNKTLQYSGLIGVLVEAVKDLSAKIKALESN